MPSQFHDAGLKMRRAEKHVSDLLSVLNHLSDSCSYTVTVHRDPEGGFDSYTVESEQEIPDEIALIIGDALHNTRAALDYALFDVCTSTDKFSKFPIRRTRGELIAAINGSLRKRTTESIVNCITDVIQPYEGGAGDYLWHLHELNNIDKHKLLITKTRLDFVSGIRAVDETGEDVAVPAWLVVQGKTAPPYHFVGYQNVRIVDKGKATSSIVFGQGMPLEGYSVSESLRVMLALVQSTIGILNVVWNQYSPH